MFENKNICNKKIMFNLRLTTFLQVMADVNRGHCMDNVAKVR